ncbi:DNA polymerase III subunit beta [Cereibacter changlensis]|uniref:DNA polymerase III subunit beta n=1 Tax=Cereibacter changlensis TaxID=402884 RepID=UPI00403345C4
MKHETKFSADDLPKNTARAGAGDVRKALAFASQVVMRRNTIPVLGLVRVDCRDGVMAFSGTDLDCEARAECAAETGNAPFSFLVDPRMLSKLARFCEGPLTMGVAGDLLTIKADDMTATVRQLCDIKDWPAMVGTPGEAFSFPGEVLAKALRGVVPCISTEETRYYLNGVYMHEKGAGLICVATDGHRLGKYETGAAWPVPHAILPAAPAKILRSIVDGKEISVRAVIQPAQPEKPALPIAIPGRPAFLAQFLFAGEGWSIRAKIIDGTFPDYTRVIPAETDSPDISVTLTHAALKRFPLSPFNSTAIKIDGDAGTMTVNTPDVGKFSMPCAGKGTAFGMNLRYLQEFTARAKTIRMEGSNGGNPFRILTDDPALLQVLMPMRV